LGSNLGDRRSHFAWAVQELGRYIRNPRVSSVRETEPVGVPDVQPPYLNAVLVGETSLSAPDLMRTLLDIERRRGRERKSPRAARTLDLDLIFYGREIVDAPGVIVPHPHFRERRFVLAPLAEVAADWVDPVTGRRVRE